MTTFGDARVCVCVCVIVRHDSTHPVVLNKGVAKESSLRKNLLHREPAGATGRDHPHSAAIGRHTQSSVQRQGPPRRQTMRRSHLVELLLLLRLA